MSRFLFTTAALIAVAGAAAAQPRKSKAAPPTGQPSKAAPAPQPPPPTAELADLIVADITLEEDKGRVRITVRNRGTAKATGFPVRMQLLCTGQFGGTASDQSKLVGELRAGDDTRLTFDVDFAAARRQFPNGALFVRATVDPGNVVRERIETDNRLDKPLPPPPLPDLKVSKPELKPDGDRVEVRVKVTNLGDAKADDVRVSIRVIAFPDVDGETVFESVEKTVGRVKAGDEKTVTLNLNLTALQERFRQFNQSVNSGKLVIRATADPANAIRETSEANNVADRDITPK